MSTLSATRWTVVQAAKAGDADALRQLFEKYRPAVVGYLLRRGMKGEAEDV
ncbi:MAG TPA: RNA polymerase subunit sigma-70, partial [Planctomycetes bacterium]|nr:RNA polymerase subunit sigma-70 [Planctomycetota bacterium]